MCSRKLRRGLKKVGRVKSCNFPTESREFPTEDIMSNHNFNFGLWFIVYGLSPKWGFLTPTFFLSKGQFPDRLTFRGGGFIPPLPLPRGHEVRRDHFTAALCSNYPPANYHDSHKHLRSANPGQQFRFRGSGGQPTKDLTSWTNVEFVRLSGALKI